MPKAIDIPVELTVAKKPLTTEQTTPTHESMTPAKAKGFGCLSCPLLPTVKGVKIGSDYKGCNSKQLAASKKRLNTHRMNGRGPKKAKVLVVFDRPESSEDRSGEAFTGGAAKSFKRMCSEFGIDTAHLRFTYAVRCHARKLTDTSAKACNGFLAAEIERIDPDMIVCVGSLPLRTVAGPSYGIESCAGSPFEHEVLGRKRRMLAIWSPQYMHVFTEKMDKWCEQFQTLAGMIDGSVKIGRGLGTYVQIKTAKEAAAALDAIQTGDVAVDLETNSLDPKRKDVAIPEFERLGRLKFKMKKSTKKEPWTPETEEATIAIVSWSTKIGTGFYVARDHIEGTWTDADRAIFDAALVRLLKRKTARKIFWNAMFECTWFRVKYGIRVRNYVDAMMWHYLYDENEKHSLKEASSHFTAMGRWDADIESLADDFGYNYRHLPLDIVGPYSGADPDGTLRVFRKIENKLPAAKKKIGKSFYPKLITALSGMQAIGAKGDPAFARFYEKFTLLHSKKAKRQIHDLPEVRRYIRRKRRKDPRKGKRDEWKFNLNSPNQIRDILFKVYKRDPLFFTDDPKNPQPKTNKVTLKAFKRDDKCPFSSLLLDYRHYDKRHGTYAMTVLEHLQAFAGTVRGYLRPTGTKSGRLCVAPETLIWTDSGTFRISDLPAELSQRRIYTISHTGKRVEIIDAFRKGREPMLVVRFTDGSYIKGTTGHRVFDGSEWRRLDTFRVGDAAASGLHRSGSGSACGMREREFVERDAREVGVSSLASPRPDRRGALAVQSFDFDVARDETLGDQSQDVAVFGSVLAEPRVRRDGENGEIAAACSHEDGEQARSEGRPGSRSVGEIATENVRERNATGGDGPSNGDVRLVCPSQLGDVRAVAGSADASSGSEDSAVSVAAGEFFPRDIRCGESRELRRRPEGVLREGVPSLSGTCHAHALDEETGEAGFVSRSSEKHLLVGELRRGVVCVASSPSTSRASETVPDTGNADDVRLCNPSREDLCGDRRAVPRESRRDEKEGSEKRGVGEEEQLVDVEDRTRGSGEGGSFGHPDGDSSKVHVVSVEQVSEEEVWDLTVDHPDHSYLAQGLFHHNSSNGPNLQNIPDDAKRVYVSHFGDLGCIISLDYSQAELRVAGSVSNDENMLRVYREGRDIHEATMMAVYEMSAEELDRMKKSEDEEDKKTYKYRRTIAKRLNFGIIYLIGPGGIVNLLFGEGIEITKEEAAESIEKFMEAYPDLAQWIEDMKRYLRRHGKSRSPFGRERLVPAAMGGMEEDEERARTQRALRQGVNAVIQGAASDLTLTSLILIDRELRRRGLKSRVILTVHDSIVIDALISEAAQVVKIARRIMENLAKYAAPVWGRDFDWSWIKCPIVSDAEVGVNWRDGIKYDPADKSGEKATTISDAIAKSRGKMEAEDKRLREEYKELQKWLKEHDTAVAA